MWKASPRLAPPGNVYIPVRLLSLVLPDAGMCKLPWLMDGSRPMFSMTSISPQLGQFTLSMLAPIIQNAGQIPCPSGIWMRASKRPYFCENLPLLNRRALVYLQGPFDGYEQVCDEAPSVVAVMTRLPPFMTAFCVPSVEYSSSWLPQPPPPTS